MGFALLAYQGTPGVNAASFDLSALADPEFSQRSSHYIFTERYRMMACTAMEANATRANFSCPTWNAIGKPNIWPVMVSGTIQSPPRIDTRDLTLPPIPLNEEFQIQTSNNLGAATEQAYGFIWIVTDDFSRNLPKGPMPQLVRATATFNPGSAVWSGVNSITFEQSLRGGVYAVVGAECQGTNLIAFRLVFPRYKLYHGRKLRPGWLAQNATGDLIWPQQYGGPMVFGEWGRFHTFEPPQLESLMTSGASTAHELRMWLVFLGEDVGLLQAGLGGGGMPQPQQPGMGVM